MATLRIPSATYRLQFNAQFRFEDAKALVEYLDQLGVTDIYASPLLQAQRGSLHGYDVTDPSRLNPELGSEQEFEALAAALQRKEMGLLLDIVPNHMAAVSENPWWMDVLQNGPDSAYGTFFDIDWHPPSMALQNKVLLPILGRPYAQALENGELQLLYEEGGFFIKYFEAKLPIKPKTYELILQHRFSDLRQELSPDHPAVRELEGILAATSNLSDQAALSAGMAGERRMQRERLKERLWSLYRDSQEVRKFIDENVVTFNGRKRDPASFVLFEQLLALQSYVLAYWHSANDEINYRRFFTINNLVGVRVEDPLAFEASHAVILRLVEKGLVTGLRVDHIDGLRDPQGYLRKLQERIAGNVEDDRHPPFYILVEKILVYGESLPREWPICGATGYVSLNALNGLFVDHDGSERLHAIYDSFLEKSIDYAELVYGKKKEVMETTLGVEMRALGHHLALLAERDRYARDLPRAELAVALAETTACLPIYRTYLRGFSVSESERRYVEDAVETARRRNPQIGQECFDFLTDVLLLREREHVLPEQREARLAFVMRWQQFTGPIMAKGLEDSALYIYNRLISLNEVGGAANSTGVPISQLHEFCHTRQKHGHMLNATTTHDTKRSEDVRARINVLSEIPETWEKKLKHWAEWNESKKNKVNERAVPDPNEEILLYQTMLGAWPFEKQNVPGFRRRVQNYMMKASREAMVYTSWTSPNTEYEQALAHFINAITEESENNIFLRDFLALWEEIAYYGALNSLSQLLIKVTAPGVPDFYQGSELWDLRLVDPDNRVPVDFQERSRLLAQLKHREEIHDRSKLIQDLLDHWQDGAVKLFVTHHALNFRRAHREVFTDGAYQPLTVQGSKESNVFAFIRNTKDIWLMTVVPRMITKLAPAGRFPLGDAVWASDSLLLPEGAPADWVNVLTDEGLEAHSDQRGRYLPLAVVFRKFPVAMLAARNHRPEKA